MENLKDKIQEEIDTYFNGDQYAYFIFIRSYSRYIESLKRRELWTEVVSRYMDFMAENLGNKLTKQEYSDIQKAISHQEIQPSMRLLWASGESVRKNPASGYNCWFVAIDNIKRFREMMFLLMSGCGVGFSVESKSINELPEIEKQTGNNLPIFTIDDSREGWADALHHGITNWYDGNDVDFNFDKIRPLGARLKTFGGRSSGSGPLKDCLIFIKKIIMNAQSRKLRPIEVYDVCTKIAEVVVAGGTRRSSTISLSDLHDEEMRLAKFGNFHEKYGHRVMANNSVAYDTKPTQQEFMKEWLSLMESGSGERGIFNRESAFKNLPSRRKQLSYGGLLGTNPCAEIILRSCQACNLTSVVCREGDKEEDLIRKIRLATILGTYQSSLINFSYLTKIYRDNCEEERLLGVSLNGQFDCSAVRSPKTLQRLKEEAIKINQEYAKRFKINPSTAITCTKPEGTGSQVVRCAPGAHPRYSQYYIRRVRISSTDPLFHMLKENGVNCNPEIGQTESEATTFVLDFPIKSPDKAIVKDEITAIDQLNHWKLLKENYAEHTISMTVYVDKEEWVRVANWLWDNWDIVNGVSFLPKEDDGHIYKLAPYEEISKSEYQRLIEKFPKIDFGSLTNFEKEDSTTGSQELACVGNSCEIDSGLLEK